MLSQSSFTNVQVQAPKERFTLVIAEVFPEDSGTFTCTASNKYGTVSSIAVLKVKGNDNRNYTKALSTSAVDLSHHSVLESVLLTETKYPLTSCLKSKSERVLENNTESRSSSRVGLRVTFKLPEDDEKKSISQEGMLSNKEPPPVLAKPKLPTMDFTSPINHVEPPVVSSHPHVSSIPLALVNPACAVQPQSSSQASSNSSSPSPIQNSVAFLSSVLPALPTCPPTNAMGLPMRAPPGSQVTLRKDHRGSHPMSYDIHNSRETLSNDTQKMFQFKNELPYYGQKEYKISNFEQRLMNEIEFHLERTPVEESDDEIQHDEIPTGKCIAPLFDQKLKNFRVMEGVPVTFTCKVVGIPIPKVYWFKDGKQIFKKNEHFKRIRSGDGTCSLHIEAATNDDDGNYTVMAANPQGRMSSTGHLIVQSGIVRSRPMVHSQRVRTRVKQVEGEPSEEHFFHPHFLQAPGDMVSHEGRICRLDYKVSGLPYPEMIWLLNGKPVYPDLNHRMLVRENGIHSLVIDPLTKGDAGTYTCIASNKAGQSSFFLELSVVVLIMFCKCHLHQDTTGYVCLLIQPSRKEDAGWYTVSAKNEAGVLSCTARLDIYAQWHQQFHSPIRNASFTGNHYSPPTGEGPDIKPVFPKSENHLMIFSTSQEECTPQSEEL
ncbi:hypothetical protein P4O66_013375 [Electrophorus voltai]|uniref:Ig-like domain-containing protein n=1 Tax=Electrophorus voltai TaxID=2609070 RepID=A0AAD9DTN9_9TELE|nr:hypothetical protein P4O66_013375 [Electrophorus voltai]